MKRCYQCDREVHELSPRSMCVTCEYERSKFNENENDRLREEIEDLEEENYDLCRLIASREELREELINKLENKAKIDNFLIKTPPALRAG